MAEYQGHNIKLNKPSSGDVKKYKVFVKDPSTNRIKKVNFGDNNMEIKRDNPERRKSFRARHKCDSAKDKTTPRYWSCKFWSNKKVSDILKEVIEPDNVDVSSIQMHETLSPLIWESEYKIKPEVRKILLKNAKRFIEYSNMENLKFKDIILTGSMANYNYNENSDLDVHIILDFDQISENKDFVEEFLKLKKSLWNDKLDIKIKGHDIEMYFQDADEPHYASGIYSLMKNKWLKKPIRKIFNINTADVKLKTTDFMNAIDELEKLIGTDKFLEKYEKIKNKIAKYRKSGLEREGEFSIENLVFKILRNSGYLRKLVELKNKYLTQELSINELLKN